MDVAVLLVAPPHMEPFSRPMPDYFVGLRNV
jgi:hypothetical protein